jgi:hypothetical protein
MVVEEPMPYEPEEYRQMTFLEKRIWEQTYAAAFVEIAMAKGAVRKRTMPDADFYQALGDHCSDMAAHAEAIANEAVRGMREHHTLTEGSRITRKTA